jgi:hypothetical protein
MNKSPLMFMTLGIAGKEKAITLRRMIASGVAIW